MGGLSSCCQGVAVKVLSCRGDSAEGWKMSLLRTSSPGCRSSAEERVLKCHTRRAVLGKKSFQETQDPRDPRDPAAEKKVPEWLTNDHDDYAT